MNDDPPFGPVETIVPQTELKLLLRTLQAGLKFHTELLPATVELLQVASMPFMGQQLEELRLQHIEVIQQGIAALQPYIYNFEDATTCRV